MTDNNNPIKYSDAEDKLFGVAGMVMALIVTDNHRFMAHVSVDSDEPQSIAFTPDFPFAANQQMSAKSVWNARVARFGIASALLEANLIARHYVRLHRTVSQDASQCMLRLLADEAQENCQLDKDETERIFWKNYEILDEAFRTSRVHTLTNRLVDALRQRRSLDYYDVIDLLSNG